MRRPCNACEGRGWQPSLPGLNADGTIERVLSLSSTKWREPCGQCEGRGFYCARCDERGFIVGRDNDQVTCPDCGIEQNVKLTMPGEPADTPLMAATKLREALDREVYRIFGNRVHATHVRVRHPQTGNEHDVVLLWVVKKALWMGKNVPEATRGYRVDLALPVLKAWPNVAQAESAEELLAVLGDKLEENAFVGESKRVGAIDTLDIDRRR